MTRTLAVLSGIACLAFAGQAFARCEDHVPQPKPQNTFAQDVGREFDTILDDGWIEFAVYEDFPPGPTKKPASRRAWISRSAA